MKRLIFLTVLLGTALQAQAQEPSQHLEWVEGEESLELRNHGNTLWHFRLDDIYGRPCIEPLALPDGSVLTDHHPQDHPWHLGLWFAWKHLNGVNFWDSGWNNVKAKEFRPPEEAIAEGLMGRTLPIRVDIEPRDDFSATITMEIEYRMPKDDALILQERRVWTISSPDTEGAYTITSKHRFTAVADLEIGRHGYGGHSLRLSPAVKKGSYTVADDHGLTGNFSTHGVGKDAPDAHPSRWAAICGSIGPDKQPYTIALFDHPENFNYPAYWFVSRLGHVGPTLHYPGDIQFAAGQSFTLRYQTLVVPENLDAERIKALWDAWMIATDSKK